MFFCFSIILCLFLSLGFLQPCVAQQNSLFCPPFDFGLYLSGNFGELRSNHFHSGIDFKTQGVSGKPIRCVADGYICRAKVQTGGYGQALYVMHDNGYMTVYGHLDKFPEGIASRVRSCQYENETFAIDIEFGPTEFRVRKGEFLAYAGNTGYSFGPHLHFEVRDSTGEELYDPLEFYSNYIKDTRPPEATSFAIYPKQGEGSVAQGYTPQYYDFTGNALQDTILVWGKVGFGIKALDFMDGTHNKYGVYKMELLVDGKRLFQSRMDRFSFSETRLINGWIDYSRYSAEGDRFQRLFLPANLPLRAVQDSVGNGWLSVSEERCYNVECRLSDRYGNTSIYKAVLRGCRQNGEIPAIKGRTLYWALDNNVRLYGMNLFVPAKELFGNTVINVSVEHWGRLSPRYRLCDAPIPLWHGAELSLKVNAPRQVDVSKLYIKRVTNSGGSAVIGKYEYGWYTANINTLGCYELALDTVPPRLRAVDESRWSRRGIVEFKLADGESYIESFRGTLNGEFILFKYSTKNSCLTLDLNEEGVERGTHTLRVVAMDALGNEAVYEKEFEY
ncbi:MAG: M23 family metallopeptidase [Bacteroidales bacterium]|nr:M23 family metallopeptidase [Bacteroidales bacterium]